MVPRHHVILCVDDEDNPLELRRLVLQKAGYDVLTARSAEEALQIISARSVDLVLSDHLMPGLTGSELAFRIKSSHPDLPVILISGVNDIPMNAESADVFLSKVEGPDRLCREVEAVLNSSRKRSKAISPEAGG
jgi:DNA-binding NtrC family response regulator